MPNRIPNKPRYTYAQQKARDLLIELNITSFPIKPLEIINEYKDRIYCLPWSELATLEGVDDPFYLKQDVTDARIFWDPKSNKYMLVYDDTQQNRFRLRWTIMHELGHFFLGHLTDFPETALKPSANENYRQDYGVLEREAHAFAAEVLCPSAIFQFFQTSDKIAITKEYISNLFLLSNEASEKRLNCITSGMVPISKDPILFRNFYNFFRCGQAKALYKNLPFLYQDEYSFSHYDKMARKCPCCHSYVANPNYDYCPYCGFKFGSNYDNLDFFNDVNFIFESKEDIAEDIRVFKLPSAAPHSHLCWSRGIDGLHHLLFCPHCLTANSNINHSCTHCGSSFINMCCVENKIVPPEARFCPYCGAVTTFKSFYDEVEKSTAIMNSRCQSIAQENEWEPYPYWDCMKTRVNEPPLRIALAYSQAYINDDDELIILVRNQASQAILQDTQYPLFLAYKRYDPTLSNILFQVVH